MKWEDYYDRFWDWAESTKISRISSLTDFTSSAEVVEIANEFFDEKIGSRLVKRALDQGIFRKAQYEYLKSRGFE